MIRIDVWSDIACPWCYIGKRNLERALTAYRYKHPDAEIGVQFHSFELSPDAPEDFDGTTIDYLVSQRGLDPERVAEMLARVKQVGDEAGVDLDFAAVRQANTRRAHEVLHLAKERGVQAAAKERLMRAHFSDGAYLGDASVLADLAVDAGLDREETVAALEARTYRDAVLADEEQAAQIGVQGVPFFVFDGRFAVAGAQPPSVLVEVLERAAAEAPA